MVRAHLARLAAGGLLVLLFLHIVVAAQGRERVAYVSARQKDSRMPVERIQPDDVIVREDNVRREVLRITPATSPMAVAVLVDNSAAVSPNITDLRRSLKTFMQSISGLGPTALIGLADRPTILVDYTTSTEALEAGADRLFAVPSSGATLLDAIVEIGQGLDKRDEDRAAIVVVTTENVEFSTRPYLSVLSELRDARASLHAVVLTNQGGALRNEAARNRAIVLDQGVADTGGIRYDVLTSMGFEAQLKLVALGLKQQQRVVYAHPDSLIPPERVKVESATPSLSIGGTAAREPKSSR